MNKTALGKMGEDLACAYLENLGYKIIDHNFRIRGGEIDIIALDKDTVVYVEVKTRSNHNFGLPEEAVTYHKIKFLQRAAKFYRVKRKNLPESERIDVVSVDLSSQKPQLKLIKNAGF